MVFCNSLPRNPYSGFYRKKQTFSGKIESEKKMVVKRPSPIE